uniref:ATP synthase F0 subunit 8 n=1 Tax=Haemaphysalis tibetensis TaxID=1811858 RepID=A0A976MYS9_9ACAR|nr:ATP synthase F0 subunit 8 [Haemaphysalis tibetensis]
MPQIFPMNWLMITLLISMILIIIMIKTFFIKNEKTNKMMIKNILKSTLSFKW